LLTVSGKRKSNFQFAWRPRWRNYYQVYLLLAAIALGVAVIIYLLMDFPQQPYRTKVNLQTKGKDIEVYYHDADHDGYSERYELKINPTLADIGIKVLTYDGKLVDQWNFEEKWFPKSVVFGDYDGDRYDEVYCFTVGRDSLFLYGFDPRHPSQFFLYRQFITRAPSPNPNPKGIWDIQTIEGTLLDSNGDGFRDLVIKVMTGFALQPRRIYVFDIHNKRIIARSPLAGAYIGRPLIFDLNKDAVPEILFQFSISPFNYHQKIPYPDDRAWLFVFNPQLQPIFDPIDFPPAFSDITVKPFFSRGQYFLAVLYTYDGKLDIKPELSIYNLKGEKIRSRELDPAYRWFISTEPAKDRSKIYLTNSQGDILTLDKTLKTVSQKSVNFTIAQFELQADLDHDQEIEYIFADAGGYSIVTNDFRTVTHIEIGPRTLYDIVTVRKNGRRPPQLSIFNNGTTYLVDYQVNPYYHLRHIFFPALWLLLYGIFWSGSVLLRTLLLYNRFWKFLFQYSNHGIALMDYKGRITSLNAMLEHHLGMRHHIQNKERYENAFAERPEVLTILNHFFKNPQPIEEDLSFTTETGSFKGNIRVYPLVGPWRIPLGYSLEITDHSQPLIEERMQVWSKTVQKMAHDIKTPLSAIQLSLQTLQMKLADLAPHSMKQVEKDFQLLQTELKRVRNITKDFLKFANLEQPNFQVVSLSQVIENALNYFESYLNGNLHIQKELDIQHDRLWADPQQLEMVFKIIIENAIDAMHGRGLILISTNLAQYLDKSFSEFIEIDIADTGTGIEKEDEEKIFEPYFTTKSDGTGMGLAIARKIIKDHGGEITITTREHFATVVRIMLPIGNIEEREDAPYPGN